MDENRDPLLRALADMEAARRRLDTEIKQVRRILDARETAVQRDATLTQTPAKGETRTAILEAMQDGKARRAAEIAEAIGKPRQSTSAALVRMVRLGLLASPRYAVYQLPGASPPPEASPSDERLPFDAEGPREEPAPVA